MNSPIERRGHRPEPVRRSGMGRFDFSKTSQRATNADGSEFSDRHGNKVVKDRFGNKHLIKNGEEKDFSYQDDYKVDISQEDGVVTASVHMDQDPVIDKIIDGIEGMLRFHQGGDISRVKELMSGDLAEQFEKEIATDEEDKEQRIASMERLVAFGRQYQKNRGQGGGVYEEPDRPVEQPALTPDKFLDEFISGMGDRPMTRTAAQEQSVTRARPRPSHVPKHSHDAQAMRNAMLCNSCDEEVSSGMKFCPECGANLR
jgi:hypothetical protein